MELTQFKTLATDLATLKAQMKALEDQYSAKKEELMDWYKELWLDKYTIEDTGITISKKTRKTMKLKLTDEEVFAQYPDYATSEVKTVITVDSKKLKAEREELFDIKTTEFISVTWI